MSTFKELRLEYHVSLTEIASALALSPADIESIETGATTSQATAWTLAQYIANKTGLYLELDKLGFCIKG